MAWRHAFLFASLSTIIACNYVGPTAYCVLPNKLPSGSIPLKWAQNPNDLPDCLPLWFGPSFSILADLMTDLAISELIQISSGLFITFVSFSELLLFVICSAFLCSRVKVMLIKHHHLGSYLWNIRFTGNRFRPFWLRIYTFAVEANSDSIFSFLFRPNLLSSGIISIFCLCVCPNRYGTMIIFAWSVGFGAILIYSAQFWFRGKFW